MAKSEMPASFEHHSHWYDSSLKSVSGSAEMMYMYNSVIHGFSTRLTAEEAQSLEVKYELHTTRTPEFLGLDKTTETIIESNAENDVIVGVLDTGVWPESKSFDDTGFGPVPTSWKGACEGGYEGHWVQSMSLENRSPQRRRWSRHSHSNHCSWIDGRRGQLIRLRARYSTWDGPKGESRRLQGLLDRWLFQFRYLGGDGEGYRRQRQRSLHVARRWNVRLLQRQRGDRSFRGDGEGILISCSAGNAGPSPYSLSNLAPWITTVGAGTIDRDFPAFVSLGNGQNYSGVSLFRGSSLPGSLLPIIYAGNASNAANGNLCMMGTLTPEKVAGKIVVCDRGVNARVQKGSVVKAAGGIGMVLANTAANGEELVADAHLCRRPRWVRNPGDSIKSYLFSEPNPTSTVLFEGTKLGIQPSPVVAAFSSRGPNSITPEILKPDIIAPGVNILAGWSGSVGPTGLALDGRRVTFNIISGTSMSCPHVSGLAALIKAAHPDWSPAAIRSALMTTAYTSYKTARVYVTWQLENHRHRSITALDTWIPCQPLTGLVYDLTADDYLGFLCALNYSESQISGLARRKFTCDASKKYSVTDLNYPTFAVNFRTTGGPTVAKYTRTLTNVGTAGTYKVSIKSETQLVKISVEPETLSFNAVNEKKAYTVTFTAAASLPSDSNSFGRIEWSDGKHIVGSPIAFSWN
ncbi:hypothetical protein FNV43_RR19142 [Rhamnella rubrinervis]|uniref:Subtilisin-like protease n=1 Tax=Rhamnella rubrinervis TaxID=2594499 RepID=A0A8K0E220_9ROSA|nr:hypothetical protein FNV43_RR19142 [Rhamnella rubrinervis]